jgi:four helix bundle protein
MEKCLLVIGLLSGFYKVNKPHCSYVIRRGKEAFRKRKYPKHFVSKLSDSEAEAAETQVWLDFALEFGYINQEQFEQLDSKCNNVIGKLVNMANQPEKWS